MQEMNTRNKPVIVTMHKDQIAHCRFEYNEADDTILCHRSCKVSGVARSPIVYYRWGVHPGMLDPDSKASWDAAFTKAGWDWPANQN